MTGSTHARLPSVGLVAGVGRGQSRRSIRRHARSAAASRRSLRMSTVVGQGVGGVTAMIRWARWSLALR